MENVLDVYKRPYSKQFPVICMDESPKQLIAETRVTDKLKDGIKLIDYEYLRKGVCNICYFCHNKNSRHFKYL